MSEYIQECRTVSVLLWRIVSPAKYGRTAGSEEADTTPQEAYEETGKKYAIQFLERGTEGDPLHFLVQPVPAYSPAKIVPAIKSVIAREICAKHPKVKKKLWGGECWTDGYFISAVRKQGNEYVITNRIKSPETVEHYKQPHKTTDGSYKDARKTGIHRPRVRRAAVPSGKTVTRPGRDVPPSGKTLTRPGKTVTPSGKTVTRPGKDATPSGKTVPRPGKDVPPSGKTVPRPGKDVPPSGKTLTRPGKDATPSGKTRIPSNKTGIMPANGIYNPHKRRRV
ncbi:MAG: IS200/IS605 family transposase [Treponema sp.]|nr:IS200/IS605 family transposase [Treponema sp.]